MQSHMRHLIENKLKDAINIQLDDINPSFMNIVQEEGQKDCFRQILSPLYICVTGRKTLFWIFG